MGGGGSALGGATVGGYGDGGAGSVSVTVLFMCAIVFGQLCLLVPVPMSLACCTHVHVNMCGNALGIAIVAGD